MTSIDNNNFEKDTKASIISVSINGLTKTFENLFKKTTAVNNLNLKIYQNQITGLLGHNGAGKSTTIFMLNGWYSKKYKN